MASFIPKHKFLVETHDMHTAGEPLRILVSGFPALEGLTVLHKVLRMKNEFDNFRKLIINEPRGHKDMYGAILMKSDKAAAFDVIFMQNKGYSPMCGHAVIALGRYVLDCGLVEAKSPETEVLFNCPCGLVKTFVGYNGSEVTGVRFWSVPAYVYREGVKISVPNIGDVKVDIVFGGAFYAIIDDKQLCLNMESSLPVNIINAASAVYAAALEQISITHPESEDLAFLYGTIVTDGKDEFSSGPSKNVCVFADNAVDRSPTGSGVTARIALQYSKNLIEIGQQKEFKSIINTEMKGKPVKKVVFGGYDAVIVEVSGMAYHTGHNVFYLEDNDPLSEGFQLPR